MLFVITSCGDNAEYSVLKNQAYIAQTGTQGNAYEKVTVGTEDVSTSLNVRLSSAAQQSRSFEFVVDEAVLEEYNKSNSTEYHVLPSNFYSLSTDKVTVDAGSTISAPIDITVHPLSSELKNSSLKFAIPIRLQGEGNVLASGGKYVILLDMEAIQSVPILSYTNSLKAWFGQAPFQFTAWTLEWCVNMGTLGTTIGDRIVLQRLFLGLFSNDDTEVRFGDIYIEANRLQICTNGSRMNSNTLFNAGQWYHIAVVCTGTKLLCYVNGVLDNSMDLPGIPYKSNADAWTLCDAYNNKFISKSMFAEVRFWNKARSQQEIANNMYLVDPKSEGLVCYFKMNEGQGNELKDATGNGGHATIQGSNVTWVQDVRIDGK